MAKKRPFKLRRVRVTPEIALGTLATDTAIVGVTTGASTDTYRLASANLVWSLAGLTAGEGPITVGIAHSDYSVTEIKECLEAFGIDKGDKISQERMNRLVRVVGTFSGANDTLNNGRPIRTKLNWLVEIGFEANIFAFNEDTAANLTTGALVTATGDYWVKDPS